MTPISVNTKQQIIALLQSNQPVKARELCLSFGQAPADPHILILLAHAHLRLGEADAALASVRHAIERGWSDANAFIMLTALLLNQGNQVDADTSFAKLLKYTSGSAEAHRQVANALGQLGNRSLAIEQIRRAVELDPNNLAACIEFAAMLQGAEQFEEAIQIYERSLATDCKNPKIFINLAMCHASLKQFDKASRLLEQAVELDPSSAIAHFHLGEIYQNQNRYHMAIGSYQRALGYAPNEAALHGSLARALRNLGDIDGALASLQQAYTLQPGNATVHNDMGICLYDDGNLEPAKLAFIEAVRLDPGSALSQFYLGMIHAQCGDQSKANERFSAACHLWPYLESFVDSYHYASKSGPDARYLSTSRQVFEHAAACANNEGLFLEFGVYHGSSINIIARLTPNIVHGFDTFQGLPIDWVVNNGRAKSVEPAGSYTTHGHLPEVPRNVRFHVGTFEVTLPGFCAEHSEPVSFVNIDCDLYDSTKTIFQHLGRQIRPGTVIVFDEYFCLPGWRDHEYKAYQEFISDSGLKYEYLAFNFFTGQVVVRVK